LRLITIQTGKIEAPDFLIHFCLESLKGTVSYNDIASKIQVKTGIDASRQAFHQRMNDECVVFFEKFLESKYFYQNTNELSGFNDLK